jgi:hypothetical protein
MNSKIALIRLPGLAGTAPDSAAKLSKKERKTEKQHFPSDDSGYFKRERIKRTH